jgi:SAM-dependent MidA family methyltransferase
MRLPRPDAGAQQASDALVARIRDEIAACGGWIGFNRFMEMALYTPGLGYYSGGARKFGAAGDFVTAPELTPVFSQTLAVQVQQLLLLSGPHVIEVGAGSGCLAADLLLELEKRASLPESYRILDLSGELRERQQATIGRLAPHLLKRIEWIDRLPNHFDGLVLANELLDALPVHLVIWGTADSPEQIFERGVAWQDGTFAWRDAPAQGRVLEHARSITTENHLPVGYLSEIGIAASDWTATWARILGQGALLLFDYGFPRHEFFHPQRSSGTLMCHYRHYAHGDAFYLPGMQDITAHVDFTAIIEAGHEAGFDLLGYTTQATFLLNCGITDVLGRIPVEDSERYLPHAQAVQKLISPAEMGELFKVMALGKRIDTRLLGFAHGDRSASL